MTPHDSPPLPDRPTGAAAAAGAPAIQSRLDALAWYHTVDVAPGLTTRGWWDLRHVPGLLPLPALHGLRCLDVGTWDGFWAFELERRGAAAVVAADLADLSRLDYPPAALADPAFDPAHQAAQPRDAGFRLLQEVLGSRVAWMDRSVYDLDPDDLGTFDLVVVGGLLLHLRDPVRALEAVRRVTSGQLVVVDYVHLPLNLRSRKPLFTLRGTGTDFQWWLPNTAGLAKLLQVAGFRVEHRSRPFLLRPGPGAPPPDRSLAARRRRALNRACTGDGSDGHAHVALVARPAF